MALLFPVIAILALAVSAIAQPQITVNPTELEFELFEGETAVDSFIIGNPGTDTLHYLLRESEPITGPTLHILAWVDYADIDDEWAHTVEAIHMYLTNFTLDTTSTQNPNTIASLLATHNVFLIPEQEDAPNLTGLGSTWSVVLNDYVNGGGLVVALAGDQDAVNLLVSSGLMHIDIISSTSSVNVAQILDATHPFATGLPPILRLFNLNSWHSTTNGTCLVRMIANIYDNLTYRNIGAGTVVYWGVDFHEYNNLMAQMLCNILACGNNLTWIVEHPTGGSVPPGGSQTVQVEVNSSGLSPDIYEGILKIGNNAQDSVEVAVTLTVMPPLPPTIGVSPDSFAVTLPMSSTGMDSLLIANGGPGILNYNASFRTDTVRTTGDIGARKTRTPPVINASNRSTHQQKNSRGSPGLTDNVYSGQFLHFGISNNYGEIMPFQYPIGNEHLLIGDYISGYNVSYLTPGGLTYLAFASYEDQTNISAGIYQELLNTPEMVKVKTTNNTANGVISVEQVFTFDRNNKFIAVEVVVKNIGTEFCNDVFYKIFTDWDVDADFDDDDWDYDAMRNMEYAYDIRYCALAPVEPQPNIIDADGWDDYMNRETELTLPPGPYIDEDGLLLMHYNLGNIAPGQQVEIGAVFATGNDLTDLQNAVDAGANCINLVGWLDLFHSSGRLLPNTSNYIYLKFNSVNLIPGLHSGQIEIESDDPVNPLIIVPVQMTVTPLAFTVIAEPVVPPVVIPAMGGDFVYSISVTNLQNSVVFIDIWNDIISPDSAIIRHEIFWPGVGIPALGAYDTTLIQIIPASWPAGISDVNVNVGMYSQHCVLASDGFQFTKLGMEGFDSGIQNTDNVLNEFRVTAPHPNPFNNETILSLSLPGITEVSILVYDINGRLVSTIIKGEYSPGTHNVVFQAEKLASGIYFLKMDAGNHKRIFKVLLTK